MNGNIKCSDALTTTQWMLRKSGIWPLKTMNYFDKFKLLINWSYAISLVVIMLLEIAKVWRNYQKLAEILGTIFPYGTYGCKLVALACKRRQFFAIINNVNSTIFNSHSEESKKPIAITIKVSRIAEKVFRILIVLLLIIYLIFPVIDHNALPIPISFELGNWYYLMHFYQMSALVLTAWNITCIDLLFTTFVSLAAAQIDILKSKLANCVNDTPPTDLNSVNKSQIFNQAIASKLEHCIRLHISIIRFLQNINGVFSEVVLIQYIAAMVVICNFVMQLFFLVDPLSTHFAWSGCFLVVILTELLLYHWFGNEVIVKSNKIAEYCYLSEWYICNRANQKTMLILMERAKQPLTVTVYKFTSVSLTSFGMIIRWSYSLFALMKNMYTK